MARLRKQKAQSARSSNGQSVFPIVPTADEGLDVSQLETWLWDAAYRAWETRPKLSRVISLAEARAEREKADVELDRILASVGLNDRESN